MSELVVHGTNEMSVRDVSEIFAKSGMFDSAQSAVQVAAKLIVGRGLGMNDYDSMQFNIIKGKVNLNANMMAAAIKRSGKYNYKVIAHDENQCVIEFFENWGEGWQSMGTESFTMEDATRAGLGGMNWKKYPRPMLFARAISAGYRKFCPDAFGMAAIYVEERGETEIPSSEPIADAEVVETSIESQYEDNYDRLKQMCADYESRTGKNVSTGMCGYFGVECIDDMKADVVPAAIDMMITKLKGIDSDA
jgi:hypothetical protein